MENLNETNHDTMPLESSILESKLQRRSFLQYAGAGAAVVALTAAGCRKDRPVVMPNGVTLDFKDDTGILNYAYALEQLEAAFYIQVAANASSSDLQSVEKTYFQDVQFHEIAHREFLKKALSTSAIGNLEVDFSTINFKSRASILAAAQTFEDLGVAAYNGAGKRFKSKDLLLIAGKIVSVEARHASWVRDRINPGSFSDLSTLTAFGANVGGALDGALTPDKVLHLAAPFIKTKINVINL